MSRIYVASSWRNAAQPGVVIALRNAGHEVYDFRNPKPGNQGFSWSEISEGWRDWDTRQFQDALTHPIAESGFGYDWDAMDEADTCVLVMPCGRSAHLEAGYFAGAGKRLIILLTDGQEPELMYKMADALCVSVQDVIAVLDYWESEKAALDEVLEREE